MEQINYNNIWEVIEAHEKLWDYIVNTLIVIPIKQRRHITIETIKRAYFEDNELDIPLNLCHFCELNDCLCNHCLLLLDNKFCCGGLYKEISNTKSSEVAKLIRDLPRKLIMKERKINDFIFNK